VRHLHTGANHLALRATLHGAPFQQVELKKVVWRAASKKTTKRKTAKH
jgi:hypothetical protein